MREESDVVLARLAEQLQNVVTSGERDLRVRGEFLSYGPVEALCADVKLASLADIAGELRYGFRQNVNALAGPHGAEEGQAKGARIALGVPRALGVVRASLGAAVQLVEVGLSQAHDAGARVCEAHPDVRPADKVAWRRHEGCGVERGDAVGPALAIVVQHGKVVRCR